MRVAVALVVAVLLGLLLGLYVSPLRQRTATPINTTNDRPTDSAAESHVCRESEVCVACTEGVNCPCPNHPTSGNVIYGCKHNGVPRCGGVCWSLAISSVGDDLYDCWSCRQ
jgi:hypothetical protein